MRNTATSTEHDGRIRITARVPYPVRQGIEKRAAQMGQPTSALVASVLVGFYEKLVRAGVINAQDSNGHAPE